MTRYIAAYDTESPACLEACRKIVEVHRRYELPATFFITGKTLEANPTEYRDLLDHPLFEVASHTYSHKMLRDHPFCGPAVSDREIRDEILRGKECVEDVFERRCVGFRAACCWDRGLKGAPDILQLIHEAGFQYVSTVGWGPEFTLPSPLRDPFTYGEEGFPDLWEFPAHGWHENLLKGHNPWGPLRILLFPPLMPEAIPDDYVQTPEEEFAVNNKPFIDKAISDSMTYVSLVWHPWSLNMFDPQMKMLDMTFAYVRKLDMPTVTFSDLLAEVR